MFEFFTATAPALQGLEVAQGLFGIGLGAAIGIGSAIFGGLKKRKAENAIGEATAEAGRLNAQQVRERGRIESVLRQREGAREKGNINTAAGASGVLQTGSAKDILLESVRNTKFDLKTIQTQSELQARVHEEEAKGALSAGRARGNAALAGGILTASSFLLGG